jgi:hypothetical protein
MPLHDRVAVYNAATNEEADLVRKLLVDAGVEAFVTVDDPQAGVWFAGLADPPNPQVWVERADVERALPLLEDYERRDAPAKPVTPEGPPVEAVCEECGQRSVFPAAQKGSVQNCPHCHAFLDVGEEDFADEEWSESEDEEAHGTG